MRIDIPASTPINIRHPYGSALDLIEAAATEIGVQISGRSLRTHRLITRKPVRRAVDRIEGVLLRPVSRGRGVPAAFQASRRDRRTNAVCWHAHRDFMRAVFAVVPSATISTFLITYTGSADFEARHAATRNAGGVGGPGQTCQCHLIGPGDACADIRSRAAVEDMIDRRRTYRGVTIDQTPGEGYYRAYVDNGEGGLTCVRADTLAGIRESIREAYAV